MKEPRVIQLSQADRARLDLIIKLLSEQLDRRFVPTTVKLPAPNQFYN